MANKAVVDVGGYLGVVYAGPVSVNIHFSEEGMTDEKLIELLASTPTVKLIHWQGTPPKGFDHAGRKVARVRDGNGRDLGIFDVNIAENIVRRVNQGPAFDVALDALEAAASELSEGFALNSVRNAIKIMKEAK